MDTTTHARADLATTRNPLLDLPAAQALQVLAADQPDVADALYGLLRDLSTQAHAKAEVSWRQRKGPMAAYWRAVGVYARHTAVVVRKAR